MINNYKSIRNVRAEAAGAVDLGEPVSLYVAEDEVKINNTSRFGFSSHNIGDWTTGIGWSVSGESAASSNTSALFNINESGVLEAGKNYQAVVTVSAYTSGTLYAYAKGLQSNFSVTSTGTFTAVVTAGGSDNKVGLKGASLTCTVTSIEFYEVTDHTYKLMAVNDDLPSVAIDDGSSLGSELIANSNFGTNPTTLIHLTNDDSWIDDTVDDEQNGSIAHLGSGLDNDAIDDNSLCAKVTLAANPGWLSYRRTDYVVGRSYKASLWVTDANGDVTDVQLYAAETVRGTSTAGASLSITTSYQEVYVEFVATATDMLINFKFTGSGYCPVDDFSIKEAHGYDYYNTPAYKFGIVSNIWDQDSGGLITTAAAGDMLEITVQGECNIISTSNTSNTIDRMITKISTTGDITDTAPSDDNTVPNSLGVVAATTSSEKTHPAILFQGVEFSEHFVHKNALQVHAKCSEAITKFRPVSLYIDSAGDLYCKHDNIPEREPQADLDHTSVDPGKWGIPELGGASGDIIPITVAGKTNVNSPDTETAGHQIRRIQESGSMATDSAANNDYVPNTLGTIMESGTGDVPITIFGGAPIGTITNWKRTIKVTAKANGAITQYCPVSLYLDQYGDYKCIADDIPNSATGITNAIWVDFRKWGIAQTTVADGEFVEIIVQGRTNVVDSLASADRTEYITKIASNGVVTSGSISAQALSSLGVVEKEADSSNGTIIIF